MGVLGIIFGQRKTVIGAKDNVYSNAFGALQGVLRQTIGGVAGISIDATIRENHTTSVDLTENPVEDGATITDHVQVKPAELEIEGVISDTPLGFVFIGNIQNVVRTVTSLFGKNSRSIDNYNALVQLQNSRVPFTVVTGLKRYENMIMTNLSVPRTRDTGGALFFTATMREIKIVKSRVTGITSPVASVKNLSSKKIDKGLVTSISENDVASESTDIKQFTECKLLGEKYNDTLGFGRSVIQ